MSNMSSQLNDLRSYTRHWLGEFIEMYQAEECLWQPKHRDYSNHTVRNKAYDRLVVKLKEVEPAPDRAMVVRKINSLRSAFRREFRKSSSKSNYESRLWYYDKLLFIADQHYKRLSDIKPHKRELNINFDGDDSMDYEGDPLEINSNNDGQNQQDETQVTPITVTSANCVTLVKSEDHTQQQQAQHAPQQIHLHAASSNQGQQSQHTAVKVLEITSLDSNSQREIQQAVNSLEQQHIQQQLHQQQSNGQTATQLTQIHHHQQVPTIQISREHLQPLFGNTTFTTNQNGRHEDEFDAVGVNVASKLRAMNPTQRIIAEKLISDVIFNGQLDNLSINSALTQ